MAATLSAVASEAGADGPDLALRVQQARPVRRRQPGTFAPGMTVTDQPVRPLFQRHLPRAGISTSPNPASWSGPPPADAPAPSTQTPTSS